MTTFFNTVWPKSFVKKMMPRTLFGRSLTIIITPLILLQLSVGYIFYDRHTEKVVQQMSEVIAGNISLACEILKTKPYLWTTVSQHLNLSLLRVAPVFENNDQDWVFSMFYNELIRTLKVPFTLLSTSDDFVVKIDTSNGPLFICVLKKRIFSRTTPIVLMWMIVSALLLSIIASIFMKNQIRPIHHLANAAEKFGKGENTPPIKPEGAEEIRQAGHAFNAMRERLQCQLTERMEMLAGVSHDLRTPLARMKLQLAMMPHSEDTRDLMSDLNEMQKMLEGFLNFARGAGAEPSSLIRLQPFLQNLATEIRTSEFKIKINCNNHIMHHLKPSLFKRCLTNLLINSKKYGREVIITIHETIHNLVILIDDNGPGIPHEQWETVLQPFVTLDKARNSDLSGVGLGLSIVRDAVRSHGGRIQLMDNPVQQGLRVLIELPK